MWNFIFLTLISGSLVSARTEYRICQPSSVSPVLCDNLKRGDSEVKCVSVSDGVDCTMKLMNNEVDFGVFTGDELFLAHEFYPKGISVLYELRHHQKQSDLFQTQMVALVGINNMESNLQSMKGSGLCHPGFSETQLLNDKVLKHFERQVYKKDCNQDLTDYENELINFKNFFGDSCRPGPWVSNETLDRELKRRYPQLCAKCDVVQNCSYNDMYEYGHFGALNCLKDRKGQIAYVALNHVREFSDRFLSKVPMFQMLCPNETMMPLNIQNPCTWITRSWDVIVTREDLSYELSNKLGGWFKSTSDWTEALRKIILGNEKHYDLFPKPLTINSYLENNAGPLERPKNPVCGKEVKWCTTSELENTKCQWVAKESEALGITPKIVCVKEISTFECLRSINQKRSDLTSIDSNYGYVARKLFGLSTVLYADNDNERSNVVLAMIKDSSSPQFQSLHDLKGKKACFPEYGGISWMTFLNITRTNNVHEDNKTCDFKKIASDIFSKACVPGVRDIDHSTLQKKTSADVDALCALCPENNCQANDANPFFRDNGAFLCLEHGVADIAFVKPKNLNDSTAFLNQHEYRMLCKNGSLAIHTGFNVDTNCAWSVTIDSEIVSRKDISKTERSNMETVLLKLNSWLSTNVNTPMNIYKSFNGTKDLLFKDSTVGFESSNSAVRSVMAYKSLMTDAEKCSGAASLSFISLLILLASLISNRIF